MMTGPTPFKWLTRIPEVNEERASVKDFVTSRLLARGYGEGVEAGGLGGCPAMAEFKFGMSYMAEDDGIEELKETALVPLKTE